MDFGVLSVAFCGFIWPGHLTPSLKLNRCDGDGQCILINFYVLQDGFDYI